MFYCLWCLAWFCICWLTCQSCNYFTVLLQDCSLAFRCLHCSWSTKFWLSEVWIVFWGGCEDFGSRGEFFKNLFWPWTRKLGKRKLRTDLRTCCWWVPTHWPGAADKMCNTRRGKIWKVNVCASTQENENPSIVFDLWLLNRLQCLAWILCIFCFQYVHGRAELAAQSILR